MKNNIIIAGVPRAGKSTVSHILSQEYGYQQTDDDSIGFYRKCGFTDERAEIEYPDGIAVRYNCVLCK